MTEPPADPGAPGGDGGPEPRPASERSSGGKAAVEPAPSTALRFLRSAIASGVSQGWRVLVTLGSTIVVRRYVSPADYGLFDWALVVFMVLGAVRDLGLAHHVLRAESRPFGNLLVVELVWGSCLVVATLLGAPWIAEHYPNSHPEMTGVLRALSIFLLFEGLSLVPRYYFDGELKVSRAVVPEVVRNLAIAVISVAMAMTGFGVWAMVTAHVTGSVLYAVLMWWRAWGQIPLAYQRGQTLALVWQSSPLALIWFLLILTQYIDPLVLGFRFGFEDIGFYTFAYQWATLLSIQILLPTVARAVFPTLLVVVDDTRELFRVYSIGTRFMVALEVPAALFLFLNADLVVQIVGGDQWVDAPTYLRILCFAPLVDPFTRLGGEVLKARHWDMAWILASLGTVLGYGIGGFWATGVYGPIGMAWVNLLPLGVGVMIWALHRIHPAGFAQLVRDLVWIYLVPLPGFALVAWLAADAPVLRFVLSIAAAVLGVGLVAWRFGGEMVAFFRARPEGPGALAPGEERDGSRSAERAQSG